MANKKRRHVKEIPLAPVLDLLTVVIFFLILSVSFVEFRQNTVPPAMTSKAEASPQQPEKLPLNPKLLITNRMDGVQLAVRWFGATPGVLLEKSERGNGSYNEALMAKSKALMGEFAKKFPLEKTLQIGFGGNVEYQDVLSAYDGTVSVIKDLVLISDAETESLSQVSE